MSSSSGIDRPDKASQPLQNKPWRAPILWLLLPGIAGYVGAHFVELPSIWVTLCPALLLLSAVCLPLHRHKVWHIAFPAAVGLLAWSWTTHQSIEFPSIWDQLPPREVTVAGRIEQTYAGTVYPERAYAIVLIVTPPALSPELKGQKLFASLRQGADDITVRPHAKVSLQGVLVPVLNTEDDFGEFLESREINFQLRQGTLVQELDPPHQAQHWINSLRVQWKEWLSASPPEFASEGGLLAAVILGERAFLLAGAMHLFAVSGLHVMIVGLTLDQLLKLLQLSFFRRRFITLLFVGLYVAVIGFSPSAMRAFSILAFYCLASLLPRPAKPMRVILASGLLTLAVSPAQLYSIGFQLSYSVVISIITFGLPLIELIQNRWPSYRLSIEADLSGLHRFLRWLKRKLIESLCISFSATMGSAPLIILHFELWTPGAIVLNAFLVPIATAVVACGVVIILTHSVGLGFIAILATYPAWLLISFMERLSFTAIRIPGFYSDVRWHSSSWAYFAIITFLCLLLLSPKKESAYVRTLYLGSVSIALLSVVLVGTQPI